MCHGSELQVSSVCGMRGYVSHGMKCRLDDDDEEGSNLLQVEIENQICLVSPYDVVGGRGGK